jgi:hypothetical protein
MTDVAARVGGKTLILYVYDFSMDGCMIQTSNAEPHEGQTVVLRFDKRCTASGTVLWRKNLNMGIKFERRLEPDVVARLIRLAARTRGADDDEWSIDRSVLRRTANRIDPPRVLPSDSNAQLCTPRQKAG